MKKVVKFGGSSLASAEQFKKVGDIIRADEGRRYVVPSAPGKRNSADTKVTDMLYDCYRTAVAGRDFKKKLQNIKARYQEIIDGLNLSLDLSPEFEKIAENFAAAAGEDYAASRGEYLNGIVMANYLGYTYIDSAEVICFDENGNFLADKTDEVLSERLKDLDNAVVPGFYGAKPDGSVKTFSRGGSDITGSIVAKAVHADIYENWTDVSGFLVTDPRIVKDPEVISTITYRELRELSYMGATVLHEDSIFPTPSGGNPDPRAEHQRTAGSGNHDCGDHLQQTEIHHHRYRRKDWFLLCHHRESDDELRNWVWEKSSGRLRGLRYFLRAYAVRNRYDDHLRTPVRIRTA